MKWGQVKTIKVCREKSHEAKVVYGHSRDHKKRGGLGSAHLGGALAAFEMVQKANAVLFEATERQIRRHA